MSMASPKRWVLCLWFAWVDYWLPADSGDPGHLTNTQTTDPFWGYNYPVAVHTSRVRSNMNGKQQRDSLWLLTAAHLGLT